MTSPLARQMAQRLEEILQPVQLEVIDESGQHAGHAGANGTGVGTHFRVRATGTAGGMPKINGQTLISAPVPLAPQPEQLQIAAIINSAWSSLCPRRPLRSGSGRRGIKWAGCYGGRISHSVRLHGTR